MQRLIEGVHRFRKGEFGRYSALFRKLSKEGQNPHTLFITCAVLRVNDIVVCGHSQCGAMAALLEPPSTNDATPHLAQWLKLATPVREILEKDYANLAKPDERATAAAEENVLLALENLHTYPCVQTRLADGSLSLHGWFFKIATAELFAFDPDSRQFQKIVEPA